MLALAIQPLSELFRSELLARYMAGDDLGLAHTLYEALALTLANKAGISRCGTLFFHLMNVERPVPRRPSLVFVNRRRESRVPRFPDDSDRQSHQA
jgi:hypothetical protein